MGMSEKPAQTLDQRKAVHFAVQVDVDDDQRRLLQRAQLKRLFALVGDQYFKVRVAEDLVHQTGRLCFTVDDEYTFHRHTHTQRYKG